MRTSASQSLTEASQRQKQQNSKSVCQIYFPRSFSSVFLLFWVPPPLSPLPCVALQPLLLLSFTLCSSLSLHLAHCYILVDIHPQSAVHSQVQPDRVCVTGLKSDNYPVHGRSHLFFSFFGNEKVIIHVFYSSMQSLQCVFLGGQQPAIPMDQGNNAECRLFLHSEATLTPNGLTRLNH